MTLRSSQLTLVSVNTIEQQLAHRATVLSVVDDYLRALAASDVETIMSLYHVDATLEDPMGSEVLVGRAAINEFYSVAREVKRVERLGPITVMGGLAGFQFSIELLREGELLRVAITELLTIDADGQITSMRALPDFEAFDARPWGRTFP